MGADLAGADRDIKLFFLLRGDACIFFYRASARRQTGNALSGMAGGSAHGRCRRKRT
ncbi:hypothetical protein SXCC_02675 [Gluconacetobacter sp. SXCC-1]|nr:hypothetical protein SXCC_02675 [Gluconacetobacter sp. SXCC-1]